MKHKFLFVLLLLPVLAGAQAAQERFPVPGFDQLNGQYRSGQLTITVYPAFADSAGKHKQSNLADSVRQEYIDVYLSKLKPEGFFTMANVRFVAWYDHSSANKAFRLFCNNKARVNKVMGDSTTFINAATRIAVREDFDDVYYKDAHIPIKKPDWEKVRTSVKKKYGSVVAENVVLNCHFGWAVNTRDSIAAAHYTFLKIEHDGLPASGFGMINNALYYGVFMNDTCKKDLEKAALLAKRIMEQEPNAEFFDTYANLLYKTGRKEEALVIENKAAIMDTNAFDIKLNRAFMMLGRPTWKN